MGIGGRKDEEANHDPHEHEDSISHSYEGWRSRNITVMVFQRLYWGPQVEVNVKNAL